MTPRALPAALYSLEVLLREAEVLMPGEHITVEVSREAGYRLERWLFSDPPEEFIYDRVQNCKVIDVDSTDPKREITIHGVKLRWPIRLTMTNDGLVPENVMLRHPGWFPSDRHHPLRDLEQDIRDVENLLKDDECPGC